jgi:hypothetical protein
MFTVSKQFTAIFTKLVTSALKVVKSQTAEDFGEYRQTFSLLTNFDDTYRKTGKVGSIQVLTIEASNSFKESKTVIMNKIYEFKRLIDEAQPTALKQVSEHLISMKAFSCELFMYEVDINEIIDEVLSGNKGIKARFGFAGFSQLAKFLESGNTFAKLLISEHTALTGTDWKRRRQEMSHQDDLDKVLDGIRGSYLDENSLVKLKKDFTNYK